MIHLISFMFGFIVDVLRCIVTLIALTEYTATVTCTQSQKVVPYPES